MRYSNGRYSDAATGGAPVEFATLAAARADTGYDEGTLAVLGSGNLVMSAAGVWVPEYVARRGTPNILGTLAGDTDPDAADPAWVLTELGSGMVQTSGGFVRLYSPSSTDAAALYMEHTEAAGGIHWVDFEMRVDAAAAPANAGGAMIGFKDGAYEIVCSLKATLTAWAPFSSAASTSVMSWATYTDTGGEDISTLLRYTLISDADAGFWQLLLNGIPHVQGTYGKSGTTTTKHIRIGDVTNTTGAIDWSLRNLAWGVA